MAICGTHSIFIGAYAGNTGSKYVFDKKFGGKQIGKAAKRS